MAVNAATIMAVGGAPACGGGDEENDEDYGVAARAVGAPVAWASDDPQPDSTRPITPSLSSSSSSSTVTTTTTAAATPSSSSSYSSSPSVVTTSSTATTPPLGPAPPPVAAEGGERTACDGVRAARADDRPAPDAGTDYKMAGQGGGGGYGGNNSPSLSRRGDSHHNNKDHTSNGNGGGNPVGPPVIRDRGAGLVKHVPIATWLAFLGLSEYEETFRSYQGVEELLGVTEADLRGLGVKNSAHRARLASNLVILKEKLNRKPGPRRQIQTIYPTANTSPASPPTVVWGPPQSDYASVQIPRHQPPLSDTYAARELLGSTTRTTPNYRDLVIYGWYHGNIPRDKAEALVRSDGEFLVRDSVSQPGDFVLTTRWKMAPLHFVVNKQVARSPAGGASKVEYQFEEALFGTVSALVLYHVDKRKPVTLSSGAILFSPVIRSVPIDYYDVRPGGVGAGVGRSPGAGVHGSPAGSPQASPILPAKNKHRRAGSQPLLSLDDDDDGEGGRRQGGEVGVGREPRAASAAAAGVHSPRGMGPRHGSMPYIGGGLRVAHHGGQSEPAIPVNMLAYSMHQRTGSEPSLASIPASTAPSGPSGAATFSTLPTPAALSRKQRLLAGSEGNLTKLPPPKPSRVPTVKSPVHGKPVVQIRNKELYDDDGRDYSDYDQVKSWPSSMQHSFEAQDQDSAAEDCGMTSGTPTHAQHQDILRRAQPPACSLYDSPRSAGHGGQGLYDTPRSLQQFKHDNSLTVPYDDVTSVIPMSIPELDPRSHFDLGGYDSELLTPGNKPLEGSAMTVIKALLLDINAKVLAKHITWLDLQMLKVIGEHDLGLGVNSGLELITLDQGHQLRLDVIERYYCLRLFVALTILTCSKYPERTQMLLKWIQIAIEMRGPMGNLYGFSAVMEGLRSPQILRLKNTWLSLKKFHADCAVLFDTRLSSLARSLNDASSALPLQNICLPHILPLVELLERTANQREALLAWEATKTDFGADVALAHLDTARIVTEQCALYRATAQVILTNQFSPRRDIADVFKTEMHLNLLWGSRGATASRVDRYAKFEEVLGVLSERVEPSGPPTETAL